ncbi:hypothetical protein [Haloglycomyces albus]|uniref:hypothetical protein n=1 Tax=Haloglycomyces albus TaxID=526067 RepID=UPI00046CA1FA|nr:hypothetical protein [Haloglycomyces albus]
MYSWVWAKLPGGLPGKIVGSLALVAVAFYLLWFVTFPAVRPYMPWSNVDPAASDSGDSDEQMLPSDSEDGDEDCVPGVNCPDDEFDPSDYETADEEEGRELQDEWESDD